MIDAPLTKIIDAIERGEMDGIDSDQIYRALGYMQYFARWWWHPDVVMDARRRHKAIENFRSVQCGNLLTSLDAGEKLGGEIVSITCMKIGNDVRWVAPAHKRQPNEFSDIPLGCVGFTEVLARLAVRLRVIVEREKKECAA